jgi:hypothetical protein
MEQFETYSTFIILKVPEIEPVIPWLVDTLSIRPMRDIDFKFSVNNALKTAFY